MDLGLTMFSLCSIVVLWQPRGSGEADVEFSERQWLGLLLSNALFASAAAFDARLGMVVVVTNLLSMLAVSADTCAFRCVRRSFRSRTATI